NRCPAPYLMRRRTKSEGTGSAIFARNLPGTRSVYRSSSYQSAATNDDCSPWTSAIDCVASRAMFRAFSGFSKSRDLNKSLRSRSAADHTTSCSSLSHNGLASDVATTRTPSATRDHFTTRHIGLRTTFIGPRTIYLRLVQPKKFQTHLSLSQPRHRTNNLR